MAFGIKETKAQDQSHAVPAKTVNHVYENVTAIEIAKTTKAWTPLLLLASRFPMRVNRTPLRLKVQASSTFIDHEGSFSTAGESNSSLDEPNRGCRHVRFSSTLEQEIQIQTNDKDSFSSWYSKDEMEQMGMERHRELNAVSRGLHRRGDKAFGKVLYRLLMRFRQTPTDEDGFLIDLKDFKLLQRYLSTNSLTGFERNVEESVASETKALVGNVQQSVMMVQAMIRGDENASECIRCASIRYSTPSQRFARALGEVHSHVVKA